MNEKQQHLTFEKGITDVPNDFTCSDNALQDCVGMTYADGEHKVIQKPVEQGDVIPSNGTLVFVHNERRIYTRSVGVGERGVYWDNDSEEIFICKYTGEVSVNAIGNTLIISSGAGVSYAKWNGSSYIYYSSLPKISYVPYLVNAAQPEDRNRVKIIGDSNSNDYDVEAEAYYIGLVEGHPWISPPGVDTRNSFKVMLPKSDGGRKSFQNTVTGLVEEYIKSVKKEKKFIYPFLIRFALELYDGSITEHTAPIVMLPSVRTGVTLEQLDSDGLTPTRQDAGVGDNGWFRADAHLSSLRFDLFCDSIGGFNDIVRSVKVYITRDVRTERTNDDKWNFYNPVENIIKVNNIIFPGVPKRMYDRVVRDGQSRSTYSAGYMDLVPTSAGQVKDFYTSRIYAPQRSDEDIMKDLMDSAVFYELCEIPYGQLVIDMAADTHQTYFAENIMSDYVLENIETQTQMPHDDFFSHTTMMNGKLFPYNNRINVFDFNRKAFEGFDIFMIENTPDVYEFVTVISIPNESGDMSVVKKFTSNHIMGRYFYYPDPRAKRVDIYIKVSGTWKKLKSMSLKEHPYLNGAYAFADLPLGTSPYDYTSETSVDPDELESVDVEYIPNTIITSEVNNPMVFYAEGSNKVGEGRILGLATQAVALSDGTAFGAQPLIVFSEKGIWSMEVSKTGLFSSKSPMPREVCNNPKSITQTDGLVFFSSEKGLMVVSGSVVKCVSEQLTGKTDTPFPDFLKTAIFAYDYRDSLLWIFDAAEHEETGGGTHIGGEYCYIYNIKSGTFSRNILYNENNNNNEYVTNVVPNYPDYLLQYGSTVVSLINRPNINHDNNTYSASIVSRPMKLENSLALKSIMQLRNIKQINGTLELTIEASNDIEHWVEINSMTGIPWKYYRFSYDFSNLRATDTFSGTVLITQERRTNKLR